MISFEGCLPYHKTEDLMEMSGIQNKGWFISILNNKKFFFLQIDVKLLFLLMFESNQKI